ncbi:MAG: primosomal protein N' [Alphaproteobacteria bacterium]
MPAKRASTAADDPPVTDAPPIVATQRVHVLLPLPLGGTYVYRAEQEVTAGAFVLVPLGRRQVVGVVWDGPCGDSGDAAIAESRLRDVAAVLDAPAMPVAMRSFVEWVAAYTVQAPGAVLRMAMSVPAALTPALPVRAYGRSRKAANVRLTPARQRVLDLLADGPPRTASDIAREAGVSAGVVKGLATAGILHEVALPARRSLPPPDPDSAGPDLSADQAAAAAALVAACQTDAGYSVTLLDGVTGSGKTEVYFEAVAEALRRGRQVLVLLPEIALTAQWFARFEARFGGAAVAWHSDLGQAGRRHAWRAVAMGEARVVAGARSALFLPLAELGLIVVDEEHDAAFKQGDGVAYHARDMAVVRGHIEGIPVILASATPSLESLTNVQRGRYGHLVLPDRHGGAAVPAVEVIDLRRTPPPRGRWIAPPMEAALTATLAQGEQVLLFLNRRGYAPLTLCRGCGHRLACPHCSAWLVEHRLAGILQCHHCGHTADRPTVCPACGAEDNFAACGPGVERLAEEAARLAPTARIAVMASDTLSGPAAAESLIAQVAAHEVDLLIGTQLVAKGHHFPLLTLVGVVDADLGLAGGDLRAAERSWQLLHQVAGRACRAERQGRLILQTYMPEHPVMAALAAGDRDRFLAAEAAIRREQGWPPFSRLAALIISGRDLQQVTAVAATLARRAPDGLTVMGPAPAPLALLRGRHRHRLLVRASRSTDLSAVLARWTGAVRLPAAVRLQIDMDPYSFV